MKEVSIGSNDESKTRLYTDIPLPNVPTIVQIAFEPMPPAPFEIWQARFEMWMPSTQECLSMKRLMTMVQFQLPFLGWVAVVLLLQYDGLLSRPCGWMKRLGFRVVR